ncbi:MAG: DUF4468 domain-containing protein [Dysgonomonas sp.]|nr:DUF4468 domain-containing protein [Dysgonomonas sp.]
MNKYLLLSFCLFFSLLSSAQNDKAYLAGAVPEVDGKVIFSKTISVNSQISQDALFDLMNQWAENNYNNPANPGSKVLLSNKNDLDIACLGEKYLVFKKNAFVLDRAEMTYQLILNIEGNKCNATVRNLKYTYSEEKNTIQAEDLISDKVALNKEGTKLNRYYDKFRRHTVDSINNIFKSIDVYLNGTTTVVSAGAASNVAMAQSQPQVANIPAAVIQPATQTSFATTGTALPGYKQTTADKIPGNIIKLLNDWTLITSGSGDQVNVMTASWGGLGMFWEKPVSFCFLNPTRYSVQTMDKGETYTISFYTEAYKDALRYCGSVSGKNTDKIKGSGLTPIKLPSGATAFNEAWMILECKKIVAQPISPDAVVEKSLPQEYTKDGYHKMYIGEIVNVWIK